MVKEKNWNWRKELGIDDTSDTPKKTRKTKKKSPKKKVKKEDWNWRKDLGIDDSGNTNKAATEAFKDGLTNHQKDYQEKKQEYNPDGTVKDPIWLQAIGVIIVFGFILAVISGVAELGKKGINKVKGVISGNSYKKEMCINRTRNIKNEFTAKKLYKQCMKR